MSIERTLSGWYVASTIAGGRWIKAVADSRAGARRLLARLVREAKGGK